MDYIPDRYSIESYDKEIANNSNERKNSHAQVIPTKNIDYEYALTLLLGALNHLSCDVAVRIDIDPDYLFNRSLLASSIGINLKGIEQSSNDLRSEYYWLIDLLKVRTTK